jgi:hypothetical protein
MGFNSTYLEEYQSKWAPTKIASCLPTKFQSPCYYLVTSWHHLHHQNPNFSSNLGAKFAHTKHLLLFLKSSPKQNGRYICLQEITAMSLQWKLQQQNPQGLTIGKLGCHN